MAFQVSNVTNHSLYNSTSNSQPNRHIQNEELSSAEISGAGEPLYGKCFYEEMIGKGIHEKLAAEWFRLGLELEVDIRTLNNITKSQYKLEEQCSLMLKNWCDTSTEPTLEALKGALEILELPVLADGLCKWLGYPNSIDQSAKPKPVEAKTDRTGMSNEQLGDKIDQLESSLSYFKRQEEQTHIIHVADMLRLQQNNEGLRRQVEALSKTLAEKEAVIAKKMSNWLNLNSF